MEKAPETSYKKKLIDGFSKKKSTIAIIGLGYVGLPLSLSYSEKGFKVLGIDINPKKIDLLNQKRSFIKHINNKRIEDVINKKQFIPTSNFSFIKEADGIIICVPTPLNKYREPDLSHIKNTISSILPFLKKGQIVSLESTSYPGTTEEVIMSKVKEIGFNIGEDFFIVYSPEREDPGNKVFSTTTIPKILGGITSHCKDVGLSLYSNVINKVVPVTNTKVAEMTKLLENIHRAVNIGLMNELKILAEKMDIDLYEVIKAAKTKPFGYVPYYPGPGLGGHCIPIDPFYLTWKAKEYGLNTKFIELAGEINTSMPSYVIERINYALNKVGKSINGSKILILGISYKKNVDDIRESPSLKIIDLLMQYGAKLDYSDPYFKKFPEIKTKNYNLKSVELEKKLLTNFDIIVLVTDHDSFDYELIFKHSNLIVDTRGRFSRSEKVIRA